MPISEFHPATKGKLESTHSKMTNFSSDLPSLMPDQEFVELMWENGQIVMQGQSIKPRKSPPPTFLPSPHITKFQEKDCRDAIISRIGKFGATTDSVPNDFVAAGPSGQTGLSGHDDEIMPWLSYPVDDYSSEFLSEFSGVNLNSLSTHNTQVPAPVDRSSFFGRVSHYVESGGNASKALMEGFEPPKTRNNPMFQLPQPYNNFVPNGRLRGMDFSTGNNTGTYPSPCEDFPNTVMQDQDLISSKPLQPSSNAKLMNFSHFSRPVALVKANLQNVERLRSNEKVSTTASSIPMESAVIESPSGLNGGSGILGQSASVSANAESIKSVQPPQVGVSVEHSEAICQDNVSRNDKVNITNDIRTVPDRKNGQSVSFTASIAIERQETEKGPEPALASSSLCSANGAGAAYSNPKQRAKRKAQEEEESGYPSEDVEDELVGVKKPANGRGMSTKRSRAAEVHNLSERRRRDRINEKMRSLQELIPNCNKADKASMLDEAIEYLKTLQLQVQIMSMGSGLCMPPMMLPPGMQHIRAPHMAHFSPMGVGMGMGMGMGLGFGMGMLDMSGSHMIPMPPMHGPHFHCPSVPGNPGLQGIPTSAGLQVFGIPGQGVPMSMPRGPPFAPVSGLPSKVNSEHGISRTAAGEDSAPSPSKDQQMQNIEKTTKTSADGSQIQTPEQSKETKECEQSTLLQISHQTSNFSGNGAINSVSRY